MDSTTCLVITSIGDDKNPVLQNYANACANRQMNFILAGDKKSPATFNLPGCEFLGIDRQKKLPFRLAKKLPDNNYAKKNLAYLQAIQKGCTVIVETDDDNIPLPEFWDRRSETMNGSLVENGSWVNIYKYFSRLEIWPRGFSLNHIKDPQPEISDISSALFCPVQQSLADENPDVDAMYRLSGKLPVYFEKREPVILGKGSSCPFNSQNTTWFKDAFPLLYLPSYCSFRMTDIWRSFIAQRILCTCGWNLSFHQATVFQKRNEHDLLKDFEQEISGYLNNEHIMEALCNLDLKMGAEYIPDNLITCYTWFAEQKFVDAKELDLLNDWLEDLSALG